MSRKTLSLVLSSLGLCVALGSCKPPATEPPDLWTAEDLGTELDLATGGDLSQADLATSADLRDRDGGGRIRLRVVAANLTSGTDQSYDPGHGIRILTALKPDLVLLQEFNYRTNTESDHRAFVDMTFGPSFVYYREPRTGIPNGIVSRYPIKDKGYFDDPQTVDREMPWVRLDIPGDKDLWAVSLHLLTASSGTRDRQAQFLIGKIKAQIPEGDYLVLGGDFNTDDRGEACLGTLKQVVVTDPGMAPYPVDQKNNGNTNLARAKPYDWVLSDPDLNALRTPVTIGASVFPNGLVFDSRVYSPLSEVMPVQAADSGAKGMQHMAVVRDFWLPE